MLFLDGIAGLVVLAFWLYCVLDVITTDEAQMRNLPKMAWVFIVIFLVEIGAIAWLIAGRPQARQASMPYKGNTGGPPGDDRPGRAAARKPDDDAAWLTQLKARAEEQREKAAEQAKPPRRAGGEAPPPP